MTQFPWLTFAVAALCLAPPLPAQETGTDPFPEESKTAQPSEATILVQVEYVEMPHEILTELLFASPVSADASALRGKVADLVKSGKASILETQAIAGRSGESQESSSIQELIYPTEYEPSSTIATVTQAAKAIPENTGISPGQLKVLAEIEGESQPTSFETRDIGSTLGTQIKLNANRKVVHLELNPVLNWHTGQSVFQEHRDPAGNVSKVEMPEIYTIEIKTALNLKTGLPALAAVVSAKNQEGTVDLNRKIMVFVKADVLETE